MSNKKILVIEDNELNMKLIRGLLSLNSCQYQMLEATDAETGIPYGTQAPPRSDSDGYSIAGHGWFRSIQNYIN